MNFGCLIPIFGVAVPRIAIVLMFFITNWLETAYETKLWPILGLIFLPITTLTYMAAMLNNHNQLNGGWTLLVIIAVIADILSQLGSHLFHGEMMEALEEIKRNA